MKPKNIKLALMAIIFCVAGVFVSCNKDDNTVDVIGIRISSSELSLIPGKPYTLKASVLPREATNKEVTWGSSGNAATVDDNGVVTPVSVGKVTITVTSVAKPEIKASCTVNVTAAPVEVTAISLQVDGEDGPVNVPAEGIAIENLGDRMTLGFVANPGNATANAFFVSYASSNEEIATVDWETGTVISVAVGEATITATVNRFEDDGSYKATDIKATCKVKTGIWVESIEFEGTEGPANFYAGFEHATKLVWVPDNTTDKTVIYTFSAAGIVSISETGVVTGLAPGEVTITATTTNTYGEKAMAISYAITVLEPAVAVNAPTLKVGIGAKYVICNVTPLGVTPAITWASDNSCVTVNSATGEITAVSAGTANISAAFSGQTLTCAVTVDASLPNEVVAGTGNMINLMKGALNGTVFYFTAGEYELEGETATDRTTIRKSVTFKGAPGAVIKTAAGAVNTPWVIAGGATLEAAGEKIDITVEGLKIDGNAALQYFIHAQSNATYGTVKNLGKVLFKDCTFDGLVNGVFRLEGAGNNVDELTVDGCIVMNMPTRSGNNAFHSQAADANFGKLVIKNSTFNSIGTCIAQLGLNKAGLDVEIESCTFYKFDANNQLFRFEDGNVRGNVSVKNCLFAYDVRRFTTNPPTIDGETDLPVLSGANTWARVLWIGAGGNQSNNSSFAADPRFEAKGIDTAWGYDDGDTENFRWLYANGMNVTASGNYHTNDFIQRWSNATFVRDNGVASRRIQMTPYDVTADDLLEPHPSIPGIMRVKDATFPGKSTAGDPRGR